MKDYSTKEIQKKLLDLFKVFHYFCQENQLTYYMIGGTLIGACRHKGFIPWDDDIDVVMPRKDYNKLMQLSAQNKLPRGIVLKYGKCSDDLVLPYAMFMDKNTTLVYEMDGCNNRIEGLYIDIFPYDGVGRNKIIATVRNGLGFFKTMELYYSQMFRKRKNVILDIFNKYAQKKNPIDILNKLEKFANSCSIEESKFMCMIIDPPFNGGLLPKEVFGKGELYKFEDSEFYGPANADRYLRSIFGDYMTLPPVEKRVSHHSFIHIDLEKPYEEYKAELDKHVIKE